VEYSVTAKPDRYGQMKVTAYIDGREVIQVGQSFRGGGEVVWRVDTSSTLPVYPDQAAVYVAVYQQVLAQVHRIDPQALTSEE
jgi:hypothetical protein